MMYKPAPVPELPPVCPPNGTLLLREAGVCREGPYIVGLSRKGPWPRVLRNQIFNITSLQIFPGRLQQLFPELRTTVDYTIECR